MNTRSMTIAAALSTLLALAACDRGKPPDKVDSNVAAAQQVAQQKEADAAKDAAEKEAKAAEAVNAERRDAGHEDAVQAQNVAEANADAIRKVALAKCESLKGKAKRRCTKKADANRDAAIAAAEQKRVQSDPQP